MRRIILVLLLISVLVVVGCAKIPETTCNVPYILVGNDCCLDSDSNKICDADETQDTVEVEKNVIQDDNNQQKCSERYLNSICKGNDYYSTFQNSDCSINEILVVNCEDRGESCVMVGGEASCIAQEVTEESNFNLNLGLMSGGTSYGAGGRGNKFCFAINEQYKRGDYSLYVDGNFISDSVSFMSDNPSGCVISNAKSILYFCSEGNCLDDIYSGAHEITIKVEYDGQEDSASRVINFPDTTGYE
jgi:hypothetical protein